MAMFVTKTKTVPPIIVNQFLLVKIYVEILELLNLPTVLLVCLAKPVKAASATTTNGM
jgi:hypothetical protein